MSNNTVLIVLVVAVAVVVALAMFRRQLSRFFFKATKEGIEAELSTHDSSGPVRAPSVKISGNIQKGEDHAIEAEHDDVEISDNSQLGRGNAIRAGSETHRGE